MRHTGIVLPLDLLERLKSDASRSGRGLATEIRQRLQLSYDQEDERAHQPQMAALIEFIKKLPDSLHRALGGGVPWYRSKFARNALLASVATFLGRYDTEDERVPDTPFHGHPDDAPPNVVGQTIARLILSPQPKNE